MISARTYQRISRDKVYHLCVKEQYYTCGDSESYMEMLTYCDKLGEIADPQVTTEVMAIAINIYEHSDIQQMQRDYGVSKEDIFNNMYFQVMQCVEWFCDSKITEV